MRRANEDALVFGATRTPGNLICSARMEVSQSIPGLAQYTLHLTRSEIHAINAGQEGHGRSTCQAR
jgi:hypothetical protein